MTPKFSEAVDPIFLYVLRLLERVERGESCPPVEEREHIRGWIRQAESLLGQTPDWQLAKYALVSWIDEVLIEGDWEGADFWRENALEQEMFSGQLRFHQFYIKASESAALSKRDALEVFYICVVLGFRGLYREADEAAAEREAMGLPPDLETWARQTAKAIRLGQGLPPITDRSQHPTAAPALDSKAYFISYLLLAIILAGVNLILYFVLFKPLSSS